MRFFKKQKKGTRIETPGVLEHFARQKVSEFIKALRQGHFVETFMHVYTCENGQFYSWSAYHFKPQRRPISENDLRRELAVALTRHTLPQQPEVIYAQFEPKTDCLFDLP